MKFLWLVLVSLIIPTFSINGLPFRNRRLFSTSFSDYDYRHYGHRHRNRLRRQSELPQIKPEWQLVWPPPRVVDQMRYNALVDGLLKMVERDFLLTLPLLVDKQTQQTGMSLPPLNEGVNEAVESESNADGVSDVDQQHVQPSVDADPYFNNYQQPQRIPHPSDYDSHLESYNPNYANPPRQDLDQSYGQLNSPVEYEDQQSSNLNFNSVDEGQDDSFGKIDADSSALSVVALVINSVIMPLTFIAVSKLQFQLLGV